MSAVVEKTDLNFTLEEYAFWPEELLGGDDLASPPSVSRAAMVPAMQRRRMSNLTNAVLITTLTEKWPSPDFTIFTTRHGEVQRTYSLLQDLVSCQDLSPMSFSQSVHNTASGIYSIIGKNRIPSTTLSAGECSLSAGLIEALSYLQNNPESSVLLTHFDEAIPKEYHSFVEEKQYFYSLTLFLSKRTRADAPVFTLEIFPHTAENRHGFSTTPEAITLARWLSNADSPSSIELKRSKLTRI